LLKILRFCGKKPPSSSSDLFVLGVHKMFWSFPPKIYKFSSSLA